MWCLTITESIRYRVEIGSTSDDTRLIAISRNPSASSPRRGRMSSITSGRTVFSLGRGEPFAVSLGEEDMLVIRSLVASAGFNLVEGSFAADLRYHRAPKKAFNPRDRRELQGERRENQHLLG